MSELTTLENGIRVVTHHMPQLETVTLGVWHEVGARYENQENNGISHFLEHMAFKGSRRRTALDIAEAIESVGGDLNAYTSREATAYHARVLGSDVELAVDILSDILLNPAFPEHELERERGVILQEIGQTVDAPDEVVFEHFQSTAFHGQPMGRSILGTSDIINTIKSSELRAYMDMFYVPENMVFSAAGNVDHQQIVDLARQYFGKHKSEGHNIQPEPAKYQGGLFVDRRDQLEQAQVTLGFEGVNLRSEDYYNAAVCCAILGGGMSSRLFQEVREKRGLVYSVYSFNSCYDDSGTMCIYAGTSPNHIKDVIDISIEQLSDISKNIEQKEFERALAQFKMGLLMSLEGTASMCERNANQIMIFDRLITNQELIERINNVNIASVQDVANRILNSKKTLALVGRVDQDKAQQIFDTI